MITEDKLIKIGRFTKPHGAKGEMALSTDVDLSPATGDLFIICEMDGLWVPFLLVSCRDKSPTLTLVQFEGIDSAEQAKAFNGKAAYLQVGTVILRNDDPSDESDDSNALSDDNNAWQSNSAQTGRRRTCDMRSGSPDWERFLGYTIIDVQSGLIGKVIHVDESTINTLLHVDNEEGVTLVPAALVTAIDPENRSMEVSLPEGFLEI